jgi:hypothetical protein
MLALVFLRPVDQFMMPSLFNKDTENEQQAAGEYR